MNPLCEPKVNPEVNRKWTSSKCLLIICHTSFDYFHTYWFISSLFQSSITFSSSCRNSSGDSESLRFKRSSHSSSESSQVVISNWGVSHDMQFTSNLCMYFKQHMFTIYKSWRFSKYWILVNHKWTRKWTAKWTANWSKVNRTEPFCFLK